jgi:hypothetical protein
MHSSDPLDLGDLIGGVSKSRTKDVSMPRGHGTRRCLRATLVCIFALHFGCRSVDDNYVPALCVEVLSVAVHAHVGRRHLQAAHRADSSGLDGACFSTS